MRPAPERTALEVAHDAVEPEAVPEIVQLGGWPSWSCKKLRRRAGDAIVLRTVSPPFARVGQQAGRPSVRCAALVPCRRQAATLASPANDQRSNRAPTTPYRRGCTR